MHTDEDEPLARTLKARRPELHSPMLGALAELPDAILICRGVAGNLTVTFANPACHAVLGLTRDARLDGEPLVVLLSKWLTETTQDTLRRAILLRRSFVLPLERVLEDGTLRRVQLNLRVTGQDSGALWVGNLKPVTATPALAIERAALVATGAVHDPRLSRRLRAEARVPAMLMDALDATPAYVGIRGRDGRYEYANGALAELFGLTPANLMAAHGSAADARIAGPDKWPDIAARVLDRRETITWPEHVVADALGRERRLEVIFSPLHGAPGTIGYVLEVATDSAIARTAALNVADQSKVEAEAVAERRNAQSLYAALPVMLQSVDTEGTIVEVNEAWLGALGYDREDVLGRPLGVFLRSTDGVAGASGDLWPQLQDGLQGYRCTLRRRDGRSLAVTLSVHVARDQHAHATGATLCFLERMPQTQS